MYDMKTPLVSVIVPNYNYAEYLPERRKMMQAWADYLDGLRNTQQKRSREEA